MCNKNSITVSPTKTKSVTMKRKRKPTNKKSSSSFSSSSSSSSLKPHKRRNRTKTRKPKYLSLRLQLSKNQTQKTTTTQQQQQQPPQLNLFPHQSDSDMQEENNVALLFTSDGGATLNGLLEDESTTLTATTTTEEEESLSVMRCPAMEGLVRKAMRRKRNDEEERWVSYSEVVEEKKEIMEEVNSCIGSETTSYFGSLSLKLDHDGILNAWSDKGSLYVDAADDEAPQTVPDLFNASTILPNVMWGDGYGCDVVGNTWKVPEGCGANNDNVKVKEEMSCKLGQREASLLRYKEKRQSRLFAKRIRYEVRKLNAEKRPRMKGRFVKRE